MYARRGHTVFSEISSDEYYVNNAEESDDESLVESDSESSIQLHAAPTHRSRYAAKPPEMINGRRERNLRARRKGDASVTHSEGLDLYNTRRSRFSRVSAERNGWRHGPPYRRDASDDTSTSSSDTGLSQALVRSYATQLPYSAGPRPQVYIQAPPMPHPDIPYVEKSHVPQHRRRITRSSFSSSESSRPVRQTSSSSVEAPARMPKKLPSFSSDSSV